MQKRQANATQSEAVAGVRKGGTVNIDGRPQVMGSQAPHIPLWGLKEGGAGY